MEADLPTIQIALCFAAALAAFWVLRKERHVRRHLHSRYILRGRQLARSLRMARLGEELAGLGYWQYDTRSEKQIWSTGLFNLLGLDRAVELQEGDAEMLLADGGEELARKIARNRTRREAFEFEFGAVRIDGQRRTFRMHARNHFTGDGVLRQIIGVVMDISDQIEREDVLRDAELMALRKAEAARRMAQTDELTGLANRRAVMDWLDRKIASRRADESEVSLIMFDIDHFKQVNDTYGHQAGDEVLKQVSRIAREVAREEDLIGRMGGEEFIIGMANAGTFVARTVAERLRRVIAAESAVAGIPAVTVSVGYATSVECDTSLGMFARADAALYEAKGAGRNRVQEAA